MLLDHADYTASTRQHELCHTDHTDQAYVYISALKDLDHELWEQIICLMCAMF